MCGCKKKKPIPKPKPIKAKKRILHFYAKAKGTGDGSSKENGLTDSSDASEWQQAGHTIYFHSDDDNLGVTVDDDKKEPIKWIIPKEKRDD